MFYPEAQTLYIDKGWDSLTSVIPLPEARKKTPPPEYTGRSPKQATVEVYAEWRQSFTRGNTALVMPDGFIGVDIDTYGDKQGWNRWFDFWDERGIDCNDIDAQCWISSSRDDPKNSGIRWFKVPTGFDWESWLGDTSSNIEIVRPGHRYAVVYPSIHPDTGDVYQWFAPGDFNNPVDPPRPEDITFQMPDALMAKLRKGRKTDTPHIANIGWEKAEEWLHARRNEDLCSHMEKELSASIEAIETGTPYDTMVQKTQSLVHLAAEGCSGIIDSLNTLYHVYTEATPRRSGEYTPQGIHNEWMRALIGAVSKTKVSSDSCVFKAPEPVQVSRDAVKVGSRTLSLTSSADIDMKRTLWLWKGRISVGALSLVAGQAGLGKSTFVYWLVAQLTRGTLFGEFEGIPKSVIICATEDSWQHTIVPRLVAAGADRTKVFRLDVESEDDEGDNGLNLIKDKEALSILAEEHNIGLLVLDPLTSRLGDQDTHKDADVRKALEPIVAVAESANFSIIGIMHHNKAQGGSNPLTAVMGSTAFGAVARSVHTVIAEPSDDEDEGPSNRRILGTIKNNLGATSGTGLDTWAFKIESVEFPTEDDDPKMLSIGKLVWDGDVQDTVGDMMYRTHNPGQGKRSSAATTKMESAVTFLERLFEQRGVLTKKYVLESGAAGYLNGVHSQKTLERAIKEEQFATRLGKHPETGHNAAFWGFVADIEAMD